MNQSHSIVFRRDLAERESRFGARVARSLNPSCEALPHDVAERLRSAREQALAAARSARRSEVPASAVLPSGGAAVLGGGGWGRGLWFRFLAVLPAVFLVAGLAFIQQWHSYRQAAAAADVDAALLADDVPPAAYDDPGFVEFLKAPQE